MLETPVQRRAVNVKTAPIGTPHPAATCCWCGRALVVGEIEKKDKLPGLRCWLCPVDYPRQIKYAAFATYNALGARELGLPAAGRYCWHVPLPSQVPLYEAAQDGGYLLWGGRAGPGKSTGLRRLAYYRSLMVPGHTSLILRENYDQLEANHTRFMAIEVPQIGGRWLEGKRMAVFGKGSDEAVIYCGHMADMEAVSRYLGIEYGLIGADEASLYPVNTEGVTVLAELSTRARLDYTDRNGDMVRGVFLPTTNPGGPSAGWLRDMFILHEPDFEKYPALRPVYDETGEQVRGYQADRWRYVAASLKDNPYMREDYAQTDLAVLSGTRYKQLAEGDWFAFAGQFFPEFSTETHVWTAEIAA